MVKQHSLPILALAVLSVTGCTASGSLAGRLPQAEIASIVEAANDGEVRQGNLAVSAAVSSEVRSYAQMMITDHTAALEDGRQVFSSLGIAPMENATSNALRDNARQTITNLGTYRGAEFDRRYMDTQVELHQYVLQTLDSLLIPSARHGSVRELLVGQRAAVATHLDRARQIRQGL